MSLKEQIMADVKSAMKARESVRLQTLRFLQSALKNREIELRPNAITDEEILQVMKKLIKQRKDSIDQYEQAGRQELADKEKIEMEILSAYLPEQMSEEQIVQLVDAVIKDINASSSKDMGKVMKAVIEKSAGTADNKMVSQIVKSKLQ